jgi:hypothetical protein
LAGRHHSPTKAHGSNPVRANTGTFYLLDRAFSLGGSDDSTVARRRLWERLSRKPCPRPEHNHHQIANGKILESTVLWDVVPRMQQLGIKVPLKFDVLAASVR